MKGDLRLEGLDLQYDPVVRLEGHRPLLAAHGARALITPAALQVADVSGLDPDALWIYWGRFHSCAVFLENSYNYRLENEG